MAAHATRPTISLSRTLASYASSMSPRISLLRSNNGYRTSPPQDLGPRGQPADPGSGPKPCHQPQTPPGTTLNIGPILALTVRDFFPQFNDWIDQIPDPRFQPFVIYHKRFLLWWGVDASCKWASPATGFQWTPWPLRAGSLNRLAGTQQQTRPVHDTLDYFLGRSGVAGVFGLRTLMMRHLLRMKVLDSARLLGTWWRRPTAQAIWSSTRGAAPIA